MSHPNLPYVQEMLRKGRTTGDTISVWMGVPLDQFEKEDLIRIIDSMGTQYRAAGGPCGSRCPVRRERQGVGYEN